MLWITRSHMPVDRVACPWLITRFIDNEAEFLLVPASQIEAVANERDATAFDAPGVELGHVNGRCSFESIILKYGLKDPIARRLEAIASGYSPRYPDDKENLLHQFEDYDALYAWCRPESARGG